MTNKGSIVLFNCFPRAFFIISLFLEICDFVTVCCLWRKLIAQYDLYLAHFFSNRSPLITLEDSIIYWSFLLGKKIKSKDRKLLGKIRRLYNELGIVGVMLKCREQQMPNAKITKFKIIITRTKNYINMQVTKTNFLFSNQRVCHTSKSFPSSIRKLMKFRT